MIRAVYDKLSALHYQPCRAYTTNYRPCRAYTTNYQPCRAYTTNYQPCGADNLSYTALLIKYTTHHLLSSPALLKSLNSDLTYRPYYVIMLICHPHPQERENMPPTGHIILPTGHIIRPRATLCCPWFALCHPLAA